MRAWEVRPYGGFIRLRCTKCNREYVVKNPIPYPDLPQLDEDHWCPSVNLRKPSAVDNMLMRAYESRVGAQLEDTTILFKVKRTHE